MRATESDESTEDIVRAHFVILYDVFVICFIFGWCSPLTAHCSSSSTPSLSSSEVPIWATLFPCVCNCFGPRDSNNHRVFALNMYGWCLVVLLSFVVGFGFRFIVDIAKRRFWKRRALSAHNRTNCRWCSYFNLFISLVFILVGSLLQYFCALLLLMLMSLSFFVLFYLFFFFSLSFFHHSPARLSQAPTIIEK